MYVPPWVMFLLDFVLFVQQQTCTRQVGQSHRSIEMEVGQPASTFSDEAVPLLTRSDEDDAGGGRSVEAFEWRKEELRLLTLCLR